MWPVVLAGSAVVVLCAGLVGFFADPLHLPGAVLAVLDQRASVVSMFLGALALLVSVAGLLVQLRSGDTPQPDGPRSPSMHAPAGGQAAMHSGAGTAARQPSASPGPDPARSAPPAKADEQTPPPRRWHAGDHIEFHGNVFGGNVVGKQVNTSSSSRRDDDEQR
ncbi:hypothetical protein DQ384_39945 [Sphaerisporangium album]|uniref:Uncharacterized protein n=1 Tax=Sphaerisporangium album TaxID=509200 RepID=A0A367EGN9_9ACTN|nr:hypothetical protein [Sphaerisporangium album]RCG16919.1 hypothetical protein DQ384_39945 [Sphaerisporangium album]